jgi:hypothetical protein
MKQSGFRYLKEKVRILAFSHFCHLSFRIKYGDSLSTYVLVNIHKGDVRVISCPKIVKIPYIVK